MITKQDGTCFIHPALGVFLLHMYMGKIQKVSDKPNFPEMEEKITKFWKNEHIFQRSLDERSENDTYRFVDGPPFVTGVPHYGSLLPSIAKDVIPRYWTMKGKRVRRVWGWDCHGLPIEDKVNRKLGVNSKKDIEQRIGVEKYIEECRTYIHESSSNWHWYIDKIGRWADMDNAYYTMHVDFMESVIWGFKKIYDQGLIYEGKRVSLYSTDTATPVSNFEVAMDVDNYRDVEDLSVFVKFQLKPDDPFLIKHHLTEKSVFAVIWTTTPWTIPANFAIAVKSNATYCMVDFEGQTLIVAHDRLSYVFEVTKDAIGPEVDKTVRIIGTCTGEELEGVAYLPVYPYFAQQATEKDYHIYVSDDVVLTEGTGLLHIAPAYGEVDFNLGTQYGLSAYTDIDEEGKMLVGPWEGVYLRTASPLIAEDMQQKEALLRSEMYTHRLPFYRGENPLIYVAQHAYFIDIQKIKDRMLVLNKHINWIPKHIRNGRFAKTVASSPDWCISRNRYWATIMPIWKSDDGDVIVVGSLEEMAGYCKEIVKKENGYTFRGKTLDLHKDMCDQIVFEKNGKQYHRVPEVLDCWMDSGSVPFAEYHYPFENKEIFDNKRSADYIIEYLGQVRAWFNVLLRIATMIFDENAFTNVICTGTLAGNDGRKMSKSYGNYSDPKEVLENIGGEALRLYLMGSPIMVGDDMNWSDEVLKEQVKTILLPIWNTYKYLCIYANLYDWTPTTLEYTSSYILDVWAKEYMYWVSREYAKHIEAYNIPASVKIIQQAIDTLSSWYIRRSRDRFAQGDTNALQTLYAALVQFVKTFAPQMPFLTEELYQHLVVATDVKGKKDSVHLDFYPEIPKKLNTKLLLDMESVRMIASLGQSIRVAQGIRLRQPLAKIYTSLHDADLLAIVKDELNVKEAVFSQHSVEGDGLVSQSSVSEDGKFTYFVTLDTTISPALQEEGMMNDIIRMIQNLRKNKHLEMQDVIEIHVATKDGALQKLLEQESKHIMQQVNAKSFTFDATQGDLVMIDGKELTISF